MGGRRLRRPTDGGERRPPLPGPLEELVRLAEGKNPVSEERLFGLVDAFGAERQKHKETLQQAERYIFEAYNSFTPAQRVSFFAMLYDRFSESYDQHMQETGHYSAIRRSLQFAMPYLRTPILDLTAGTGVPLMYALEFIDASKGLRGGPLDMLVPQMKLIETDLHHPAYANEISGKMREKSRVKLVGCNVGFTSGSAFDLPENFRGRFNTVLCAQTFHLISDEDKTKLVRSMREALAPGGVAVVLEEDPFRITQSVYIESLSLFLRAVVRPVKAGTLIAHFETNGFTKLEDSAVSPIDSEHAMRLHIFQNIAQP